MNMNMNMNMKKFDIGDKVTYNDMNGTITRDSVLGFSKCCCYEVTWDNKQRKVFIRDEVNLLNKLT
jgi:hypothetical protein